MSFACRIARRVAYLRREDGFTMLAVMATMLVASLLTAAALMSATDDAHLLGNDLDQKQAYLAARAGISDYQFHLNQDPNYWTGCPAPANVAIPGTTGAKYSISPLTATGWTGACSTSNPVGSMIEASGAPNGTYRIRASGTSGDGKVTRSIVATFQNDSFLNYIWYTVYETLDPSAYQAASDRTAAAGQCHTYWRNGRLAPSGSRNYCVQIYFTSNDVINGPLHTEDSLAICGSPTFGRSGKNDPVEVVDPSASTGASTENNGGCSNNATYNTTTGQPKFGANTISPPPNNGQLKQIALPSYSFTGQTDIVLNSTGTMNITNNGTTQTNVAYPSNGVLYVSTSSCPYDSVSGTTAYTPFGVTYAAQPQPPTGWAYSGAAGCGTVTVHGTYTNSLTIASDNDIVIDGNISRPAGSNALLGLVAQNYVRVYHPCSSNTNQSGSMSNPSITAAILTLSGSFIVDNYTCGAQLGNLSVTGAIAQIYRGPVGQIGTSGYLKNYTYDDNLRAEEPPHFLEPVQAAWHVVRETECNPGTSVC
jgi:hypothetical protein